ncbi:MoaD/ThiS family protein [Desulfitobacterium sp. Sab5]|uniref:MoaD/ThiS family protein n=1 Tax=Desulfitobacterium TaxID=36853 RepID=UPI003CF18024
MRVTIKLFATFRDGRFKMDIRELPEGENRVIDILQSLGIAQEEVAICLVNGRDSNAQTILADGDTLSLFPPVGGG